MINEHDIEELAPGFNTWLNESENFSTRYERLCAAFAHLDAHDHKELMSWLKAAYMMGYYDTEVTLVPESNGSVVVTFDLDERMRDAAATIGLKFILYCEAAGITQAEGLKKVLPNV
jgi:hypothetical protein